MDEVGGQLFCGIVYFVYIMYHRKTLTTVPTLITSEWSWGLKTNVQYEMYARYRFEDIIYMIEAEWLVDNAYWKIRKSLPLFLGHEYV